MNDVDAPEGGAGPLEGIRVLAIEHMLSMPFATRMMALLGADVVKVEPLGGEPGRVGHGDELGVVFMRGNWSKRSIAIDLKQPDGRELVLQLAKNYDVVAENMRPGVLRSLGLSYEQFRLVDPSLVMVSVSGFGNQGGSPYSSWPALAPVVDAVAGWYPNAGNRSTSDDVGGLGGLGDVTAGIFAVIGTLSALLRRSTTGRGDYVDIAMADTSLALNDAIPLLWAMGKRSQSDGSGVISAFRARDGMFAVTIVRRTMFDRFAEIIGQPGWKDDADFCTRQQWADNLEPLIRPAVERWAARQTAFEAARSLAEGGVAAGLCNDYASVVRDPHYVASGMFIDTGLRGDEDRPMLVTGLPMRFAEAGRAPMTRWPEVGEHSVQVLRDELGLSDDRLEDLVTRGIIADGSVRSERGGSATLTS